MQFENLSDEVAIEALKNETQFRKLKDKILTTDPCTFFKVMSMATKLIKIDNDRRLYRDDEKPPYKKNERIDLRKALNSS